MSDRNLLFGILALQMDFITRGSLIKAMNDWSLDKEKPLGGILVANEALSTRNRELLEQMVDAHVEAHEGDPERSLAALSSVDMVKGDLERIDATELMESLACLSSASSSDDVEATIAHVAQSNGLGEQSSLGTRFRIIRPHAEGGLGKVSIAMDCELNREVALKEIKGGFAKDEDARTRFTLEAEITGGLEHPGIVPVYGLGHRDDGQPFYAMRFIKGDSLKEACAKYHNSRDNRSGSENALEFRKLLGRFIDVCQAIEYAHSRGVLHRDLKPGNIMLGKYGETLVVDWGLAKPIGCDTTYQQLDEKILQPSSADSTPATQMGSAVGTPHFMSPEQAAGKLDELGPASDVYSLGATLYHLLVNRSPFTERRLDLVLAEVQKGKFKKPREIDPSVPKPLEAICLKAMARQPADRYATPNELSGDVDRWLADEPILANKEPMAVRVRRWQRKHPRTVAALAATLVLGVVSTLVVLFVVGEKNSKLRLAFESERSAKDQMKIEKDRADDEAARAQSEADISRAVVEFINDDLLGKANPGNEVNRDISLREVLDQAARKVDDGRFSGKPRIAAAIHHTLGVTYLSLGEHDTADHHIRRAVEIRSSELGSEARDTLVSTFFLSRILYSRQLVHEALIGFGELLERSTKALGDEDELVLMIRDNIAHCLQRQGDYSQAAQMYRDVIAGYRKIGKTAEAATTNYALGYALRGMGEFTEALQVMKASVEESKRLYGLEHPDTASAMYSYARILDEAGVHDEVLGLLEQSYQIRRKVLGPTNRSTFESQICVVREYYRLGRQDEALALLQEVERVMSANDLTGWACHELGHLYRVMEQYEQAAQWFEKAATSHESIHGRESSQVSRSIHMQALMLANANQFDDVLRLLEESLRTRQRVSGPMSFEAIKTHISVLREHERLGHALKAEPVFREFLDLSLEDFDISQVNASSQLHVAHYFAKLAEWGRWRVALKGFKRILEENPDHAFYNYTTSLLLLEAGDVDGYVQLCRHVIGLRVDGENTFASLQIALTCAQHPAGFVDQELLKSHANSFVKYAEQDHSDNAIVRVWALMARALVYYRSGEYPAAIQSVEEALDFEDILDFQIATLHLIGAMSHHQLGQHPTAQEELDKARSTMQKYLSFESIAPEQYWGNWLGYQLLEVEAENVLSGK